MKSAQYLGRVFTFAFRGFTIRTDGMQVLAASLVPLFAPYVGIKNPSQASSEVLAYIGMAALAFFIIRICLAPYYIWREDQSEIVRLKQELKAPEFQESLAMASHRIALRQELGDKLASLIAFAECARTPEVLKSSYDDGHLASVTRRLAELISLLSYDVILRVASLNIQGLCLKIVQAGLKNESTKELMDRLWAQRKLTFRIIHRQDQVNEIFSLAELENLIAEYGESFEPKGGRVGELDARDPMRELRESLKELGPLDSNSIKFIRGQLAGSKPQ